MAIYMKFGSITGQVTTEGFKEWIELLSFQFGAGRGVGTGAGGKQREGTAPSISEIAISKVYDKASPGLYQDALAGAFDTKVEIKLTQTTKNKTDTYLSYELSQCGISGYSVRYLAVTIQPKAFRSTSPRSWSPPRRSTTRACRRRVRL